MLSEAKHLKKRFKNEILRFAQNDSHCKGDTETLH